MIYYEVKKIFSRTSNRIAILLLTFLLGIVCYFAVYGVEYVNEEGNTETGFAAVQKLKMARKEWAGELTEEKIIKVMEENARINATKEYQSDNIQMENIAFGWKQGFYDIRQLLAYSFSRFREYDYYKPDSLVPKDAKDFYNNRVRNLKEWLNSEAKNKFSENEKEFLLQKYEELEIPLQYDYAEGWKQLFEYAPSIIMLMVLILGFIVANIFSGEFQLKADAIFYSSCHGRGKAVKAKIKAGFYIVTGIYWLITILYSVITLGILGMDGAGCAIQTGMAGWKSFYNITYWQEYLLVFLGGYVGCLFILFLTMFVSAKTKSAILAVIVPFVLIFIPSFLSENSIPIISRILGIWPDQLLQMNMAVVYFNLYEIGGKVVGAVTILLTVYTVLFLLLCPLLYQVYRKIEVD